MYSWEIGPFAQEIVGNAQNGLAGSTFCLDREMPSSDEFILGEYCRTLDERSRVSIPGPFGDRLAGTSSECVLVKERPGCLSLWETEKWQTKHDQGLAYIQMKMQAGKLDGRISQVQLFGRLLSTRHTTVPLTGPSRRLLIPEGFRPFLDVPPGEEVMVVGAAVCIEIWKPESWLKYLESSIPKFRRLFDRLSDERP